ncbi:MULTISPECIES: DUF6083 domain-containing protein [unclassified Streptomyces]|uniref:DUF6083 domain-containing protein n=1 Tax=unclassified Streptomyces TaxID=2593676 RepID=UPI000D103428|nr:MULTISPECIES: DUF6083 domain-containing protein [unclassified Streptomyces]MYT31491.1 hypothetical protein [Streptomyces sp. SID8354]
MGVSEDRPHRLGGTPSRCPQTRCPRWGLPCDRVPTLEHEEILLEPDMTPLAHTVPPDHRWIELSDGQVALYGVCPPVPDQRCRIEHELACPALPPPDPWCRLTALRHENARRAARRPPPQQCPDTV